MGKVKVEILDEKEALRVITPEQFKQGYYVQKGMMTYHRRWSLVGWDFNGNAIVREPKPET